MTLFYAVHNLLPPLARPPEPMPLRAEPRRPLDGLRFVLAASLAAAQHALTSGMLGVVGFVALLICSKRRWLAALVAASSCFTPVVINGMFSPGYAARSTWRSARAIIAHLRRRDRARRPARDRSRRSTTHFILLRAPMTTDLSSWRGSIGALVIGSSPSLGLGGVLYRAQACSTSAQFAVPLAQLPVQPTFAAASWLAGGLELTTTAARLLLFVDLDPDRRAVKPNDSRSRLTRNRS